MMSSYILYPEVDAPTPNIYSGVPVARLNVTAGTTNECPLVERHILNRATRRTCLGRWQEAVEPDDFLTEALPGHAVEDRHELGKAQVTDLAAPQPLHAVNVQVFKAQHVVLRQEAASQLEMTVAALVGQSNVSQSQTTLGFTPIDRAFGLAGQGLVQPANLGHILAEKLRRLVPSAFVVSKERFEAKIKTADLIRAGFDRLNTLNDGEAKKQSPGPVPLDRDRLDLALDRAAESELVVGLADLNPVIAQVLPTGLLECEAGVLLDFLESWPAGLARPLAGLVLEEPPIGRVVSLDHILHRLTAEQPPLRAPSVSQFGDVPFHATDTDIAAEQPEIAPLQGRDVVPDDPGHVYLLDERPIPPIVVEAILEGFALDHVSDTFLIGDILLYNFQRNGSDGRYEFAPRPKRRQPLLEPRELFAKLVRRVALDLGNDAVNAHAGINIQEQVDVIGHDFHIHHGVAVFALFVHDQLLCPLRDRSDQNRTAIFRAKDDVVLATIDNAMVGMIWLIRLL